MRSIAEIRALLKEATPESFPALERTLVSDERKGVQQALATARRRIEREEQEHARLMRLYTFEQELAGGKVVVGLDEVGRGPLAGPVSVGAVVLDPAAAFIGGLNDSKQIAEAKRPAIADEVKRSARAFSVVHIPPEDIDAFGIMACLKRAFKTAVANIEAQGIVPEVILLDGNPLGFDAREINVVKGDARCASIAAASVIAKGERAIYVSSAMRSWSNTIRSIQDMTSLHRRGMAVLRIVVLSRRRGLLLFIVLRIARTSQRIVRFRVTSRTPNS